MLAFRSTELFSFGKLVVDLIIIIIIIILVFNRDRHYFKHEEALLPLWFPLFSFSKYIVKFK